MDPGVNDLRATATALKPYMVNDEVCDYWCKTSYTSFKGAGHAYCHGYTIITST